MIKKSYILFIIGILSFLLIGCDPPHYINFVNNTSDDVRIKIKIDSKNNVYFIEGEGMNGDSIILELKENESEELHFGIGNWSDDEINQATKTIKKLEIETSYYTMIYKDYKSIQKLLKKNRSGIIKGSEIKIEIK